MLYSPFSAFPEWLQVGQSPQKKTFEEKCPTIFTGPAISIANIWSMA